MPELRRDRHWWRSRTGDGLVAGAPGTFFRLTERGSAIVDSIERGESVAGSPLVDRLVAAGAVHPLPVAAVPGAEITVVMPVFARNEGDIDRVQRLVNALAPLAVVVVDDASPVAVRVDGARCVRLTENSGPGAARNAGLREVPTPYVAFVDDDVEVTCAQLLLLSGHFSDPNVAFVAPRVSTVAGRTLISQYESVRSPLDMRAAPARVRPRSHVPYVPSAVLMARTAAANGAFDESLRFGEDVEFEWRVCGDTTQCRYEPAVVCHHPARPTLRAFARQRFTYGRSAADIDRRIPRSVAPLRGNILHVLPLALLLMGQLFWAVDAALVSMALTQFTLRRMGLSLRDRLAIARLTIGVSSRHLATAITREWWPLFVVMWWWQPTGFAFAMAASGLVLADIRRYRPPTIAGFVPFWALDNLAYGAGVWAGVLRTRSVRCVLPALSFVQRRGG